MDNQQDMPKESVFKWFFEKDPKSPLFRLGLAENQRWVWRVWSIHLSSCWNVSTKARRPAVCLSGSSDTEGQRTWHLSGTTASIRDPLHCTATSGTGAKGYLKQSQEPWGWTVLMPSPVHPFIVFLEGQHAQQRTTRSIFTETNISVELIPRIVEPRTLKKWKALQDLKKKK